MALRLPKWYDNYSHCMEWWWFAPRLLFVFSLFFVFCSPPVFCMVSEIVLPHTSASSDSPHICRLGQLGTLGVGQMEELCYELATCWATHVSQHSLFLFFFNKWVCNPCDLWHLIYKAWTFLPPIAGRCWSCNGHRLITMLINLHLPDFFRCAFQFACHYACIWFSLVFLRKRTHTSYFRQITRSYSYALEMCISDIITATFSIWIIFKHTYSM